MKTQLILPLLLLVLVPFVIFGQDEPLKIDKRAEVTVSSWKIGTETVAAREIRLDLSRVKRILEIPILGASGTKYLLEIEPNSYSNKSTEHWQIRIFELRRIKKKIRKSWDLFSPSGGGGFSQGEHIGILYPEEEPIVFDGDNEAVWGEGGGFYWFKTVRKINIENFCVTIRVGDYKFKIKDPDKLEKFEVFINFGPRC